MIVRGYKVTDAQRKRLCGIACSEFEQLKKKGCHKLNISPANLRIQLQDGTIVDEEEFFLTLPAQTIFIFLKPGEKCVSGADLIYNALIAVNLEYLRAGQLAADFMTTNLREKVREFTVNLDRQSPTISRSHRSEDPEWFSNVDTRAKTKERFMFMRAQERIRGYYFKSYDEVKKSSLYKSESVTRAFLDRLFKEWRGRLKEEEDFGGYFDRFHCQRLCDVRGEFSCQGVWNKSECLYNDHRINPYLSREARVVFSTWNLDHGVERSRTIIPSILDVASQKVAVESKSFNILLENGFSLLFTTANLKLVNIICHDKGGHLGSTNKYYEKMQKLDIRRVNKVVLPM